MSILDRIKNFFRRPKIKILNERNPIPENTDEPRITIKSVNENNNNSRIEIKQINTNTNRPRITIMEREAVEDRIKPISAELDDRMTRELDYYFPEYRDLESMYQNMVINSIDNNYKYNSNELKELKYLELTQYFKEYFYGLVNQGYINNQNKEKIISRVKSMRFIAPYEDESSPGTYGDTVSGGINLRDCLDEEKGLNLREELYAKTFFHEFTHYLFSDNYLANSSFSRGTYPTPQSMIDRTDNHYYIRAFRCGGFIDEIIAQDTAERVYNAVHGLQPSTTWAMYDSLRFPGHQLAKALTDGGSIKDLAQMTYNTNWIYKVVEQNENNYGRFAKVMTTLQSKLQNAQSVMSNNSRDENYSHIINIHGINIPDNYLNMDENLRREDLLDDNSLMDNLRQMEIQSRELKR